MRKYSLILLSLVVGCLLFSSCADEELANKGAGKATEISLSFETPDVEQVVTKGINGFNLIEGLYLFIFDSSGNLEGDGPLYYGINSKELSGTIDAKIPTTTGSHYIFAVANASNSAFAIIDGLESVATKDQLLSKTASLKGDLLLSGNLVPMVGTVNGADANGLINITPKGSYKVQLERIVASVKFEVSCGNSEATFNLKSYEVVNVPQTAKLWGDNVAKDKKNWTGGTIDSGDENQVFEFYMFENKQKPIGTIISYEDRERKVDPKAVSNIEFANASSYATYVILKGLYTGPATIDGNSESVSAEVSYYVHLGDINNNGNDNFDTERNVEYTYKISISGVDKLVTEVIANDPYDRGDGKISLTASTFNLDAHYEVFNITVPRGNRYEKEGGDNFDWLSFRILDKTNTRYVTKALTPNREAMWDDVMKYKVSDDTKYNGELITTMSKLNEKLLDYFNANSTAQDVVVTCYADENIGLNTYRECLVFRDIKSNNGSTIIRNGFNIRQNYLRKFFDNKGSYYGLEVLNETGRLKEYKGKDVSTDMSNGLANMKNDIGTKWPSVDEMKTFSAACMSRNRDENGNGKIDGDELKWYLPAINQYIGMWIGADALQEARLYTLNKHSTEWRYVSNSYDNSEGKRMDHWILWGDQGSSTGMKKSGEVSDYQLRCIRNIGSPTGNGYYSYDRNKREFTMNLVGDAVYRNKQESGELGRKEGHMGTDNKVYRKFKVAGTTIGNNNLSIADQRDNADKNASKCSEYYEESTLKDGYMKAQIYLQAWRGELYFKKVSKGTGKYNYEERLVVGWRMVEADRGDYVLVSEAEAHTDSGKWRLPNQREQSLMFAEGLLYGGYQLSRTFSTFLDDNGFGFDKNLRVFPKDEIKTKQFSVRCVRDTD